ncbi:hypothetical protein PAXRUDRAFT_832034, partial [Paxillus rubicundulus Ve08.2h10]
MAQSKLFAGPVSGCPMVKLAICLGTVGYGQPRLTKACTTRASRLLANLWLVVVGYGWAE